MYVESGVLLFQLYMSTLKMTSKSTRLSETTYIVKLFEISNSGTMIIGEKKSNAL